MMTRRCTTRRRARWSTFVTGAALALLTACTSATPPSTPAVPAPPGGGTGTAAAPVSPPVAAVCDHLTPGSSAAPAGAVTVDPAVDKDLGTKVDAAPPGTTFWLAPGHHTLGSDEFGQVQPKSGDTFIGGPGAVLDGRGLNRYAFTGTAGDVTIKSLTVTGFVPPANEGVVNHDSGNGWVIEGTSIENNRGAALMAGARQQVRGNCLRANGQYGMNAFQAGNGIVGLVVEGNEIVGNNTDDWEKKVEGCGCTGGIKFWGVNGADIRGNWVHGNHGPGLWADTNDNDFLIENNVIEDNDGEAVFYETSYNMVMRGNLVRRNAIPSGQTFAERKDDFPVAAVYLSESGGEPRVPARTDKIEIYDNDFTGNWSGVTAWENADRFCNSAANTSTGVCTLLVKDVAACSQPAISTKPLYDDCRWKTQRVDIHDNRFVGSLAQNVCAPGFSSRMAVLSNVGTYPDWSPYKGDVIQKAISTNQQVSWHDNTYDGTWTFLVASTGRVVDRAEWQATPDGQDARSLFGAAPTGSC